MNLISLVQYYHLQMCFYVLISVTEMNVALLFTIYEVRYSFYYMLVKSTEPNV